MDSKVGVLHGRGRQKNNNVGAPLSTPPMQNAFLGTMVPWNHGSRVFLCCFIPPMQNTYFGIFVWRPSLSTNCSKVGVLHWRGHKSRTQNHTRAPLRLKVMECWSKTCFWELSADQADPPDLPDLPETVSSTAARTPPSTRAGGQDDVS